MTDPGHQERLSGYLEVWWQAVNDFTAVLEELPVEQWSTPTDLPGWDVHAVAAHVAHLESVLAGGPEESPEESPAQSTRVAEPDHVRSATGRYTEQGVVARRGRTPDEIINEIRSSATARHTALLADPPTDASARPGRTPGGAPWTWETLLRNRPLDVWMHEQDIRRAVGRPGGLDSPAAAHVADHLAESLGLVLARRVAAPPGTTAVLAVDGSEPKAFGVTDAGRGERLPEVPADPTVRLQLDRESFIVLAGGRRRPTGDVRIEGDEALGRQLLDQLAVTP